METYPRLTQFGIFFVRDGRRNMVYVPDSEFDRLAMTRAAGSIIADVVLQLNGITRCLAGGYFARDVNDAIEQVLARKTDE